MFYTKISKIKVFDSREGFPGLFNKRAEVRIYSYVKASAETTETAYYTSLMSRENLNYILLC
jgi:hypothetical protein